MKHRSLLRYLHDVPLFARATLLTDPVRMEGGYDTVTWAFELADTGLGPRVALVLRQFPAGSDPERARRESTVQNALASVGYPVPVVHVHCTDADVLGSPFMIMDRAPGEVLLNLAEPRASLMMGETHARLHELPVAPVEAALTEKRLAQVYRDNLLERIGTAAGNHTWIERHALWLRQQVPAAETRRLCHGDFHKLNLLQEHGVVTAVIDWSNFSIMEPAFDVANTWISFSVVARHLIAAGDFEAIDLDQVLRDYRQGYATVRALDETHLDYYLVLRASMMLLIGAMGFGAAFGSRPIVRDLCRLVSEKTGIELDQKKVPALGST